MDPMKFQEEVWLTFWLEHLDFIDLSWMGVLSAVGDMQNSFSGKLIGLNKSILTKAFNKT